MIKRIRRFARDLHEDESGPNTVEWVLLIIVALVVLAVIYMFVQWVIGRFGEEKGKIEDTEIDPGGLGE